MRPVDESYYANIKKLNNLKGVNDFDRTLFVPPSNEPSYEEVLKANFAINNSLSTIFKQNKLAEQNQFPNRDSTPLTQDDKVEYIASNPWILDNDKAIRRISTASVRADIFDFEQEVAYENKQREILSRASTSQHILTGIASGIIDPISWAPAGNIYKSARAAWGAGKSALSVGAATAGSISLQEMILQQEQYNRTFNESVANAIAGGVLGSVFGGGLGAIANARIATSHLDEIVASTDSVLKSDERKLTIDENGNLGMTVNGYDKSSLGQSAGAAQTYDFKYAQKLKQDNTLYNVPAYVGKFMKQTPYFRLIQSPFGWYRRFAADNLSNASILAKHLEGRSSGTSIELGVSVWMGKMLNTQSELDKSYQAYTGITGGVAKNIRAWKAAKSGNKMSREAFNAEVYRAAISDDVHAIPEVQNAISSIRPFFEDLKNEAVKLNLLPADVGVTTAASYMMRVYNRELIERNRFIVQDSGIVSESFQPKVERYLRETQIKIQNIIDDYEIFNKEFQAQKSVVESLPIRSLETIEANIEFLNQKIKNNEPEIETSNLQLAEQLNFKEQILKFQELNVRKFQEFDPNLFDTEGNLYQLIGKGEDPNSAHYKLLITAHADSIIDNILGLGTEMMNNRFNIGAPSGKGGGRPLNNRVFKIADTEIAEYLEKDMGQIIKMYGRNMGFAVEVAKYAQRIGVPEDESIFTFFSNRANEELQVLIRENPSQVNNLNKEFKKNQEDVHNSILAIQGFYGMPQGTWNINVARWLNGIKQWQSMRLLGMVASYAPVDMGLTTFQYGLKGLINDGITPLIKSGSLKQFNKKQANDIGLALETESGRLFQSMVTGAEVSHNKNKYEVFSERAARGFGNINLANQLEDIQSSINGSIAKAYIVRSIKDWKNGKITKKQMRDLAVARIDKDYYPVIYEQLEKTGSLEPVKGSYYMNLHLWDQTDDAVMAASQIQQGLQLMIEQGSMRTSFIGDRPLVTRTTTGSALLLFKNFLWASQNKLLFNSLIQRRDSEAVQGVLTILAMGALAYVIRQTAYGRPIEEDRIIFEAIDNSGVISMFAEPSLSALKFFGLGPVDGLSRYYGRSDWSLLLGPTFSIIEDGTQLARVTNGFFGWENVNEKDIQKTMRLLPLSNWGPINPVINYFSKQTAEAFDLKTIEEMNRERGIYD